MTRGEAKKYRVKIETAAAAVTEDAAALELIALFPLYTTGTAYAAGDRFQCAGKLYRVIQAHTSQADWFPPDLPALYTEISVEEYPEWVQPTGAQDAYPLGAKVMHNGKRWTSDVDANVWEPGVYGWTEVIADAGA